MNVLGWGAQKLLGRITANADLCVRCRSPLATCSLCADICPEKGIILTEEGPLVERCRACGRCVRDCPERVYTLDSFLLADYCRGKACPVIGCTHDVSDAPVDGRISCFTQLEPEWLATVLQHAPQLILYVDQESCRSCVNNWSAEALIGRMEQLSLPYRERLTIVQNPGDLLGFQDPTSNRREFIAAGWQRLQKTGKAEWQLQTAHYFSASQGRPISRRALLMRPYQKYPEASWQEELPYRRLRATACQFCGACVAVCPHEALRIDETEMGKALGYAPVLCSQCGLCQDVCPVSGLHWDAPLRIGDLADPSWDILLEVPLETCSVCGDGFYEWPAPENHCCRFCRR